MIGMAIAVGTTLVMHFTNNLVVEISVSDQHIAMAVPRSSGAIGAIIGLIARRIAMTAICRSWWRVSTAWSVSQLWWWALRHGSTRPASSSASPIASGTGMIIVR
jgi:hypothetical protein